MKREYYIKYTNRTADQLEDWKQVMVERLAERYESIMDDSKKLASIMKSNAKGMTEDKRINDLMFYGLLISRRKAEVEEIREEIKNLEKEIEFKRQTENSPLKPVLEHMEQLEREDLQYADALVEKFETVEFDELTEQEKLMYVIIRDKGIRELQEMFADDRRSRFNKLVKQIDKKVGNATQAKLERNEHNGFDGWVKGDEGAVWLHTFIAGGWNIQKAHFRTKVTAYSYELAK